MKKLNLIGLFNYVEEGKLFNLMCELFIFVKNIIFGVFFKREGNFLVNGGIFENNFFC